MHNYRSYSQPKIPVSIVGARGYSGLELAKLLFKHPAVELINAFATKDFRLSDDLMSEASEGVHCWTDDQVMSHLTDIVFLATPAEVSLELAPKILAQGKKVIDLSGAFRLKKQDFAQWYGFMHNQPEALASAEYGLSPFCGPNKTASRLIANPGCYATAVSLALIPLLKHDLIEQDGLVIDAKSGTTGAGRKPQENLLMAEVAGECLPYRIGKHQHYPEIQESIVNFSGHTIEPHFATNLLPVARGIIASIFAVPKTRDSADITHAYQTEYANYPLVRFGTDVKKFASLKNVVGTPYANLSYVLTGNKLYLFSTIDNLLKGAASQAIENMNRLLDLPLTFSLTEEG